MKRKERDQARELRRAGNSIKYIARTLRVAKSSVSLWVRSIELSQKQKSRLSENGVRFEVIERRRQTRLGNTTRVRNEIMHLAGKNLGRLTKRDLLIAGIGLYWGEGGKTLKGMARIANSDPDVIRIMMRFFREICRVPESKFRAQVHTFSHLKAAQAEAYWSKVSGVPCAQFYKTYVKPSIASKSKKDSLPYGTLDIYVCDTKLFLTIMGWIKKLSSLG